MRLFGLGASHPGVTYPDEYWLDPPRDLAIVTSGLGVHDLQARVAAVLSLWSIVGEVAENKDEDALARTDVLDGLGSGNGAHRRGSRRGHDRSASGPARSRERGASVAQRGAAGGFPRGGAADAPPSSPRRVGAATRAKPGFPPASQVSSIA